MWDFLVYLNTLSDKKNIFPLVSYFNVLSNNTHIYYVFYKYIHIEFKGIFNINTMYKDENENYI